MFNPHIPRAIHEAQTLSTTMYKLQKRKKFDQEKRQISNSAVCFKDSQAPRYMSLLWIPEL